MATADAEMVMWPENVDLVWLALRQPDYVSQPQMAAQMFDRQLSPEGRRRMELLGSAPLPSFWIHQWMALRHELS